MWACEKMTPNKCIVSVTSFKSFSSTARSNQDRSVAMLILRSSTISYKYGHFWLQKTKKTMASTIFHKPLGEITMAKRCFPVFSYAARQRLAAWGACTSTLGKIWAGSGYTSQQATMPTIAWGPAPTSGMLKTNILRYSATPCCNMRSTSNYMA